MEKKKSMEKLLEEMTLEEKVSFCSGKDFWHLEGLERSGIPSILVTDGPHGVRKLPDDAEDSLGIEQSVPATCFPTASLLASTWNTEMIKEVGRAIGEECREEKVAVLLGPGANIKRSPLCGRNFEYFSEDPYLSGEISGSFIEGVQSEGIGTSLKHFAVNNQEKRRMTIDAIVDERALREIYLAGFERAINKGDPLTVMCAYNRVNGDYCSEHQHLLIDILRREWGYAGALISDWGAVNDRVKALKAGLDVEMPGDNPRNDDLILKAVKNGEISEKKLDETVKRILKIIRRTSDGAEDGFTYHRSAHHEKAREIAAEGTVLLKNEGDVLPLKKGRSIAVLGELAKKPRYQGSGSSMIRPNTLDRPLEELKRSYKDPKNIRFAQGYRLKEDRIDPDLMEEAVDLAGSSDITIIFAGLPARYESEGFDRDHMKIPSNQNILIEKVSEVSDQVIVILQNGAPVEMPWIEDVKGIIEAYLGGEAGGGAVADIILGLKNPSGKLAESFPYRLEDNPSYPYFPGGKNTVEYRESIFVGYRYYDHADVDVMFPFGHGLSYTDFELSGLWIEEDEWDGEGELDLKCAIKNTGDRPGKEVVQVYVEACDSNILRPPKELGAFKKVRLEPGEEKIVTFSLEPKVFSYYNTSEKRWVLESGVFNILVGRSSRDIVLQEDIVVAGNEKVGVMTDASVRTAYLELPGKKICRDVFEELYGKSLPPHNEGFQKPYDMNTPLGAVRDTPVGERLFSEVQKAIKERSKDHEQMTSMMQNMIKEMPIRNLPVFSQGEIDYPMTEAFLKMINGHYLHGGFQLMKSMISKKSLRG